MDVARNTRHFGPAGGNFNYVIPYHGVRNLRYAALQSGNFAPPV